jgi:hypothetical protein
LLRKEEDCGRDQKNTENVEEDSEMEIFIDHYYSWVPKAGLKKLFENKCKLKIVGQDVIYLLCLYS